MVERAAATAVGCALYMSRVLRVPLFPLPGAILFPRSQLPLHIFEPRYREMVRDAIDGPGRIAMIQPHRIDDDNRAPLYAAGNWSGSKSWTMGGTTSSCTAPTASGWCAK